MYYYAVFDPNDKIVLTIHDERFLMIGNDRVRIAEHDPSIIGKKFIGTVDGEEHSIDEFIDMSSQKIFLAVTLDQEIVTAGTIVNATAEVKDQDGNLAPINNTYFVPIVRNADNWQAKLLEVTFNNGQASQNFAINEPGIYMIRLDLIHPTPIAKLTESPILIVKDSA